MRPKLIMKIFLLDFSHFNWGKTVVLDISSDKVAAKITHKLWKKQAYLT